MTQEKNLKTAIIARFLAGALVVLSACSRQPAFKDSGIARALFSDEVAAAAAKPAGVHVRKIGGGLGGGVYRVELQTSFAVEADPLPPAFMKAFRREVEEIIVSHGAKVEGRGGSDGKELVEFQFDYSWMRNQGIIRIHTEKESAGLKVRVFCYEHSR
jgi:hypothetical protein